MLTRYVGTGIVERNGRDATTVRYKLALIKSSYTGPEVRGTIWTGLSEPVLPADASAARLVLEDGCQTLSILTSGPTVERGLFRYDIMPTPHQEPNSILRIGLPR